MENPIVKTSVFLIFVWMYSLTEAKAPLIRYAVRPPDFYQVIVTNNLFRPLGWTPPKAPPAFELIATVMKSNGTHKALIRRTATRQVNYVAVGELAGDAIIEKIHPRRVTLNTNGEQKVYTLPPL